MVLLFIINCSFSTQYLFPAYVKLCNSQPMFYNVIILHTEASIQITHLDIHLLQFINLLYCFSDIIVVLISLVSKHCRKNGYIIVLFHIRNICFCMCSLRTLTAVWQDDRPLLDHKDATYRTLAHKDASFRPLLDHKDATYRPCWPTTMLL